MADVVTVNYRLLNDDDDDDEKGKERGDGEKYFFLKTMGFRLGVKKNFELDINSLT